MAADGERPSGDQDDGRDPAMASSLPSAGRVQAGAGNRSFALHADHVVGAAAILAASAVLAASGDLPFGTLAFPGAGMMPKLVCGLMILFGAMLFARAASSVLFSEISWRDLPHGMRVLGVTAVAVALYTTLGFIVSMSLLLFALTALEHRNPFAAAAYSIGVSVGTYALFVFILRSPLEQGVLGF
jgi:Tripartite tricarboxylate transporter TctB family